MRNEGDVRQINVDFRIGVLSRLASSSFDMRQCNPKDSAWRNVDDARALPKKFPISVMTQRLNEHPTTKISHGVTSHDIEQIANYMVYPYYHGQRKVKDSLLTYYLLDLPPTL
jgi:hypothetical protein